MRRRSPWSRIAASTIALTALAALGCDDGPALEADVGIDHGVAVDDGALSDSGRPDASEAVDTGLPDAHVDAALAPDMAPPPPDYGLDAELDARPPDAALPDASPPDVVSPDMAPPDAAVDAESPDAAPPAPRLAAVQITELAARGGALLDEDGDASDWIELYNPNDVPYALGEHRLTDRADLEGGWVIPPLELPPHGYRVIFASGKDRRDPAGWLHTDFRLDADGESLALVDPEGRVLDGWATWPHQIEGASWGRPMVVERSPIEALARRAPLVDAAPGWSAIDFDDGDWAPTAVPIGYDRAEPPRPPVILARSDADFSAVQGQGGWFYGYAEIDPDAYGPDDFVPFPDAGGPWSAESFWNGAEWRWFEGDPPWTRIDATGGHPSGPNNGVVHVAVRRWVSAIEGDVVVDGVCHNPSARGDGVRCRVIHEGVERAAIVVDGASQAYAVELSLAEGDRVDFVLDHGPGNDGSDSALFTGRVLIPGVDAGPGDLGEPIADSVVDWSAAGQQGARGWTYGYADRTAAGPGPYTGALFEPFPRDGAGHSATDFWNGSSYNWFQGDPPWTMIGQQAVHPNGANNQVEHWAIRRYVAERAGPHLVRWAVRKSNPNGRGVAGRLWHTRGERSVELDWSAIAGGDAVGVDRLVAVDLEPGDALDLAVDPTGPDGDRGDNSDGSESEMRVWAAADLSAELAEVVPWPAGEGGALRLRFAVPEGADRVELDLRYDDGIIAWLDGELLFADGVADPGAIDEPAPGARAAVDRATSAVYTPTTIALPDTAPGPRVLAIAGLDGPAADRRFLVGASAWAARVEVQREGRYLEPTPGADNRLPVDLGPALYDLSRDVPAVAGEPIEVVAGARETSAPIDDVQLIWRVGFEPEQTIEMTPDPGGARWRAEVPAEVVEAGAMLRWAVAATDVDGRTSRAPPFPDPLDSEQYVGTVVDDPAIDSALPVLHWFIAQPGLADRPTGTRSTLWFGGELYDNVRVDLHGQSTRGFPKKSYDVDFNRDHRFRLDPELPRMKDINLLSTYADKARVRNTMAYAMVEAAGADGHLAFPVRIQQNGAFFAVADFVEDGDDRWIERLGHEPVGALYKVYDGFNGLGRAEKKTQRDQPDDDYAALLAAVDLEPDARRAFLYDRVDMARMANYLAVSFIHGGTDCCHKNYYLYQSAVTGQWWMVTWDVDLTFGRQWTGNYFDDRMYPETGLFIGRDIGGRNRLLNALYADPQFVEMYLRRTRTLVDTLLQPPGTPREAGEIERRIDALIAQIGADAQLDADRWPTWGEPQSMAEAVERLIDDWLRPRRAWVYGTLARHAPASVLVPGEVGAALARYRVPTADDPALVWTQLDFDDADWAEGPLGLGYEDAPAQYAPLIGTEVRPNAVDPAATTVQLRVPFELDDPAALLTLTLSMKYDDGYVAWLNGVEVARRNVEGLPAWDARAAQHGDNEAVQFEGVDITPDLDALQPGLNVLAIQVVNAGPASSDLLIQPMLADGNPGRGTLPEAADPLAEAWVTGFEVADEPAESWVAIDNPGARAIDISGWRLEGAGVEHTFTAGTVIPAEAQLLVVADLARFRTRAESPTGGEGRFVQGNWSGVFDPALGWPHLVTADGRIIDAAPAP